MMKTPLIAVAAVASLGLAACASGDDTTSSDTGDGGTKTVTVWMYPVIADEAASRTFWQEAETSFEAANTGIDLKVELQPWAGSGEKVSTALASGKGPDLVLLTPDALPGYVETGGLLPLAAGKNAAFLPTAQEAATIDGKQYAVPLYHTVVAPVYNKKVFADAGLKVPTTWDEIKAAAPTLAAKNIAVMDYSGLTTLNMTFYPLLWQAGGSVFTEDGTAVAFNSAEGKAALGLLVDLMKAKALPADAATKDNKVEGSGLTTGKVAMTPYAVKADAVVMQKALGAENVEIGLPLTGKEQVTFGLPGMLARTSIGKDDKSVNSTAEYLASAEFAAKLATATGYFPARNDVPVDTSDPLNELFHTSLQYARPGEVNAKARPVMEALKPHLQAALQGSKTVDQALADAEKEANALLQK